MKALNPWNDEAGSPVLSGTALAVGGRAPASFLAAAAKLNRRALAGHAIRTIVMPDPASSQSKTSDVFLRAIVPPAVRFKIRVNPHS
ncbi:MAG: hypothetical protein JO325_21160 [Solirubrobacterales bacterium]|nr:hypothetical protein [Solirubrobacterales bacterium]